MNLWASLELYFRLTELNTPSSLDSDEKKEEESGETKALMSVKNSTSSCKKSRAWRRAVWNKLKSFDELFVREPGSPHTTILWRICIFASVMCPQGPT